MSQLGFDFNSDINKRKYSVDENHLIEKLVFEYKEKKNIQSDEIIITQLFYETFCIEIATRLKNEAYFEGEWSFINSSLADKFYTFLVSTRKFYESSIIEFVMVIINNEFNINHALWSNNDTQNLQFDRKITENIIESISTGNSDRIILPYLGYLKIWNTINKYNKPFNNAKAILIHRLFADAIWPKENISYKNYDVFLSKILKIIPLLSSLKLYLPFFDEHKNQVYSNIYLMERNRLLKNIETLFVFDNIDESESYSGLVDMLMNQNSNDFKIRIKNLIKAKIELFNYPSNEDMEMFKKLYEGIDDREYGKYLLSKFYLFDKFL